LADYWYAECRRCKWVTQHTEQDAAIHAAEDHVIDFHRDVAPAERGRLYIGHVQNRTENGISAADLQVGPTVRTLVRAQTLNAAPATEWAIELAPTTPASGAAGDGGKT
jgi:hypothetical protein